MAICTKHGVVGPNHGKFCRPFRAQTERQSAELEAKGMAQEIAKRPPRGKGKDAHAKLNDVRLKFNQEFLSRYEVRDAVDYLFYEIDLLMYQVEELQAELKELKKGKVAK